MVYATLADLTEYTGEESVQPGDERKLQRASELLDSVLMSTYYVVDANGVPTDSRVIAAFKNAVCAQVEFWRATQDELGARSQMRQTSSVKTPGTATEREGLRRLCPRAREAISTAPIWRHKPLAW